jgi:hypothetical protein
MYANSCSAGSDARPSSGSHPAEGRLVLRIGGWLHVGRIVIMVVVRQSESVQRHRSETLNLISSIHVELWNTTVFSR